MRLTFKPRGAIQLDGVKLIYRNFEGRGDQYNREGDRNFCVMIPDRALEADEIDSIMALDRSVTRFKDADGSTILMINDTEVRTVSEALIAYDWNVTIKAPRTPEDSPYMYLKVKVKFNERGPIVWLDTDGKGNRLTETTVKLLDKIDIDFADLDIRPYDWVRPGNSGRTAYLDGATVFQNVDRHTMRYASEEYPAED